MDERRPGSGQPTTLYDVHEALSSRRLPSALRPLATRQDGIVTRQQLHRLGLGHDAVASRTAQGVWREIGPRVVVLHTGLLTPSQRRWAGVLHVGNGAVLAMATAAELGGLRGFESPTVHVTIRHSREISRLEHPLVTVAIHQTRHPDDHLVLSGTHPRHDIARAAVELASQSSSAGRSRAVIAAVVQQRLARPAHLMEIVEGRATLPRRKLICETIDDVEGGAQSLPELAFARACRCAGLPKPARQQRVRRSGGSWYLDNDFTPWLVTVEINGVQHRELHASEADDRRRAGLQVLGRLVVDISSWSVRHQPQVAVLRTAEALLSRGWTPNASTVRVLRNYAATHNWTGLTP